MATQRYFSVFLLLPSLTCMYFDFKFWLTSCLSQNIVSLDQCLSLFQCNVLSLIKCWPYSILFQPGEKKGGGAVGQVG
jgi:hypothetical protein